MMPMRWLPVWLILLLANLAGAEGDSARITYTKEFPGSQPDYMSIAVQENGRAFYRTAPDEPPIEFQLSPEPTGEIFSLARRLNSFQNASLESKRKVAQMGKKTFAFESGAVRHAVSFNHTEDPNATALNRLFEGLARTQWHRDRLEYLLRFDRLGLVKELLLVESDLDQQQLVEPTLLLPVLEKIRSNRSLVNVAQERAAGIVIKLQPAAP
jgi:hypothetical protein